MFRGRFEHALDAKGRLSIPARFREILATSCDERLVVTNWDQALWAYPVPEWLAIEDRIGKLSQFRSEVKDLLRVFVSGANECSIDKAGRIQLPPTLRDYAGIVRDVVVVGAISRIEIWAKERWDKVFEEAQASVQQMGDRLAELGI